ncbi:hypothetical protein BGX30_005406 [Mortierella sp. GBA39]|nr:hypothetical protein BGX30_005406 [Mortierella sp. GBA39]
MGPLFEFEKVESNRIESNDECRIFLRKPTDDPRPWDHLRTSANALLKGFWATVKSKLGPRSIAKCFITGVSPLSMADHTSGFNVATYVSWREELSGLCGLTEEDVYAALNLLSVSKSEIEVQCHFDIMKANYIGYTFASSSKVQQVFNTNTCLEYLENYFKAMENGHKEQADRLQSSFQQGFSELHAALDENLDLQRQLNDMQQLMLHEQSEHIPAVLLEKLPRSLEIVPIVLGKVNVVWNVVTTAIKHLGVFATLAEKVKSELVVEGADKMIKYGVTIAGFTVPALAAVSAPGAIDLFKNSLDTISPKDQHRALGNLYRTIAQEGHVKWVCINHYRLACKEKDQQAFATAVELNGGRYDPHLG